MSNESYIKKSGQMWKIWLFFILQVVGVLSFLAALIFNSGLQSELNIYGILVGFLLFGGSFIWVFYSVKCKKCAARLVWRAMKDQTHQNWLISLFTNKNCPVCHTNADLKDDRAQKNKIQK